MRIVSSERRRLEAQRLRTYVGAIKEAEATTDEAWADQWVEGCRVNRDTESTFIPRSTWIAVLKHWALIEAEKLALSEAA